jgi:hypothetical protein
MVTVVLAGWAASGATQSKSKPRRSAPAEVDLSKLQADLIRSMTAYRESLEKLLAMYERDVQSLTDQVDLRRSLYKNELISKRDLEEYERALAKAQAEYDETRAWIVEADLTLTEVMAREELLKLPKLAVGGYRETAALMVFNGGSRWTLAEAPKIIRFFSEMFGRVLPISAFGQTAIHDRMKFDHHDAMDVAIHPDSSEGRVLMEHLRKTGIPFLAFRNKVAGSATGAHIHIGSPSLKTMRAN